MSDINETSGRDLKTSFDGRTVRQGDIVSGRIVKITGEVAFVDYGARSEAYIALVELRSEDGTLEYAEGDEIQAEIVQTRSAVQLSRRSMKTREVTEAIEKAFKEEAAVDGVVVGVNKGGYEVRLDGVRAFCPGRQFSERPERDPLAVVGQTFAFKITEYKKGKNIVVSRRALLDEARTARSSVALRGIREGEIRQGKVTRLQGFGAFVDLGDGLEGLVHISEICHDRIRHPSEKLSEGDAIEVKVLKVEAEAGKVALSMKALESDPWTTFANGINEGQTLMGRIERVQPFGAFVSLAPGVEGLLHVSGISAESRIEDATTALTVGDTKEVVVERVDFERKRIGLLSPEVFAHRQPVIVPVKMGDVVSGPVTRTEKFGFFVEVAPKIIALVAGAETDTPRDTDYAKAFPVGTIVEVKIVEVDRAKNRVRASRKALKSHEDDIAMAEYRSKHQVPKSLGNFGDLLKDFLNK